MKEVFALLADITPEKTLIQGIKHFAQECIDNDNEENLQMLLKNCHLFMMKQVMKKTKFPDFIKEMEAAEKARNFFNPNKN